MRRLAKNAAYFIADHEAELAAIVIFTIGTLIVWKAAGPALYALAQWSVK